MQSKGQVVAKVIGIILVLLLVAGLVAVIYKFTNGFNEDFKTFYVEYEGKQILAQNSELALEPGKTYRFDVKYTFDTQQSETKDYIVEIVPNAEQDFEYLVDGETYLYSKAGDLFAAFSLKKQITARKRRYSCWSNTAIPSMRTCRKTSGSISMCGIRRA